MRYRIWFPAEHFDIAFEPAVNPGSKPFQNTIHHPVEDVVEYGHSANAEPYIAEVFNAANDCSAGQYELLTNHGTSSLANDVAFNIIVP